MGRKLVETSSLDNPHQTSKHIDSLKELFNILGAQVTYFCHDSKLSYNR